MTDFVKNILPVLDNLRRALDFLSEDSMKNIDQNLLSFIEGVKMTEKEMIAQFKKYGINKINVKNKKFDPNLHQAMFEVINNEIESNTVVEIMQDGYSINDRILRPAMVGVSKKDKEEKNKNDNVNKEKNNFIHNKLSKNIDDKNQACDINHKKK